MFEVKCLLCRASWGIEGLPWLRRTWAKLRHIEVAPGTKGSKIHNSRCAGCYHKPINGNRYRCVKCPSKSKVDLCSHCFGKGGHIHHPFVVQETVGSELLPAPRKGILKILCELLIQQCSLCLVVLKLKANILM